MSAPKFMIDRLEQGFSLPPGNSERFSGYGVMGLTFASGHVLGMRRFPVSSVGPGYISVWHRYPDGKWTFCQNVQAQQACPRYFGKAISASLLRDITITWTGTHRFTVTIGDDIDLHWNVSLKSTPSTRVMNSFSNLLPEVLWHNQRFLKGMSSMAGIVLHAGHIGLTGVAPNGQLFVANPRQIWIIDSSTATLGKVDFGTIGPLENQARIGDFWIPQRGIFAVGGADFEVYDPSKHTLTTSLQQSL